MTRRLRNSTLALVTGAVILAVGTAVAIGALRAHADERREAQIELATLTAIAERHTARVWEATVEGGEPDGSPSVSELRAEIDAALDRLAATDPAGDEILAVVRAYRDYETAATALLVALADPVAGPLEDAVAELRDASRGLTEATGTLDATSRDIASAASLAANLGTTTTLVSAAILLALLFRRSERARRAEALLRREREVLQASEDRFRALVHRSSDMTTVLDALGTIRYQSPSSERLLGRAADDLVGTSWRSLVHPDDAGRVADVLDACREGAGCAEPVEWRTRAAGRGWVTLETVVSNLVDEPHVNGIVLNSRDVTERLELQHRLYDQAYHDALTGLANRERFLEELGRALATARRDGTRVGVLLLDLDDFKQVNDSLGHPAGDELLVAVADRLRRTIRTDDLVARLAGDEFAILVQTNEPRDAVRVAERIVEVLREPFAIGPQRIFTQGSVGVVVAGGNAEPSALMRDVDIAMYRAKGDRATGYAIFEPSMHAPVAERLRLLTDLRSAIDSRAITLAYQPIVTLERRQPVAVEALARWRHADIGDVPPSQFIGLAEESGMIGALGAWAAETAISQLSAWRELPGLADLAMHVNLSARQLVEDDLDERLTRLLADHRLPAGALVLELTESAMAEMPESAVEVLARLRRRGVRVAIDDFGTGSSTLGRLHRLPVDVLKIDRLFTASPGVAGQPAVVRAIVEVARALGLTSVAEGIETEEQATQLRELGCNAGQGYLLGAPMDPAMLTTVLAAAHDASARREEATTPGPTLPRPEPRPA